MTNTSLHRSHKHLHICQTLADVRCFSANRKVLSKQEGPAL